MILLTLLMTYIPFTHMSHFFTKYFMYHDIRWSDEPNLRGGEIERKLTEGLDAVHLEVINESGQHNVPAGSESHFKVVVVSGDFEGKKLWSENNNARDPAVSDAVAVIWGALGPSNDG